jgi:hypothetical protein
MSHNLPPTKNAHVLMSVFRQLPAKERKDFIAEILSDSEFAEDIQDIAIAQECRAEQGTITLSRVSHKTPITSYGMVKK